MLVRHRSGLHEVAIFIGAYLMYFGVRALTQGDAAQAQANASSIVRLQDQLGISVEGDVQDAVLSSPLLVDAANAVYIYGHWPVIIGAAILLFHHERAAYYRLRNAILLTGLAGLVIFALFPVAPPRLTALPLIDTVTSESSTYRHLFPPSLVNEYAAMPSFHAGWNVLLCVVVFQAISHWGIRLVAIAIAVAMVVAVVATANHYVVDVVAGVTLALLGLLVLDVAGREDHVRPDRATDSVC